MKIKKIEISGIGGIRYLSISFNEKTNIICGPNGAGKTTVLNCISYNFTFFSNYVIKRNSLSESGVINILFEINGACESLSSTVKILEPSSDNSAGNHAKDRMEMMRRIIFINTNRFFKYKKIEQINNKKITSENELTKSNLEGVSFDNTKNWLVNRHVFSHIKNSLPAELHANLKLAEKCFSLLNKDYKFDHVNYDSFDVFIKTPNGTIWYEYLSSGFKSCFVILVSIIKEIEERMPVGERDASKFDGVVLIDELELHLHPEWQARIVSILNITFPKIQFIVTTHSPHIVQNAKPNQIIALGYDNENVILRDIPNSKYGFMGWTIEEVLVDVMGMSDTRSEKFRKILNEFNDSIIDNDIKNAKKSFKIINEALHPDNMLRKYLNIQLSSISEKK